MAVYTHVPAEALTAFLARYDVGDLISAKGIAEGVENSNYMVDTTGGRYFLTLYEKRVDAGDLPFFFALLDHVATRGCHVPRALPDRDGLVIATLEGRPACLIEFLPGVSPTRSTAKQAHNVGAALGELHAALADFTPERPNTLGPDGWQALFDKCGRDLDRIEAGLHDRVEASLGAVIAAWPHDLARSAIHADLFPDNVLMLGERVTGLIDFYFACTDIRAYDLAVTHGAWAFDIRGQEIAGIGPALVAGYDATFGLTDAERSALPILARGACLRFLLTRAWDWLNTPADALVVRKDPLAYLRRLDAYENGQGFA